MYTRHLAIIREIYSRFKSRNIYLLIALLGLSLIVSMFILMSRPQFIVENRLLWKYKEKDITSRLLSVPILLYHNIDGKGPFSIDEAVLRSHFQLLKDRGIRVIPLSELVQRLEKPKPFSDRVIVITFDDGYFSMYTKLLPLVKEFKYPVTLFVYTEFIYSRAAKGMTWERLRDMDKAGIDIQCHSISHKDLTTLSAKENEMSRKKLFDEIYLSRRIIELYMGKEMEFYAFPFGRYDLRIVDMCLDSGYRRVFSTDYGSNVITRNNYCLRRQHIKRDYSLDYIKQLVR